MAKFKLFESDFFLHIPDEEQTKLEPKSHRCIFLGYNMELKGY